MALCLLPSLALDWAGSGQARLLSSFTALAHVSCLDYPRAPYTCMDSPSCSICMTLLLSLHKTLLSWLTRGLQLGPSHTAGAATWSSPMLPPWLHCCRCCRRGQTPVIAAIEARIAEWTRLPPDHGEPIQVLRYQNGQKYDAHWVSTLAASTRRGEPCVHWACPDCAFAGSAVSAGAAAPAGPPIGSV
jgi:hypothetical protein